jgi:hypothetical protein
MCVCRAKALGMDLEWLPDGGVKTILGPRPLTRVFPGRKGRRMWFNTVVGMHGKELSSATAADGAEIPAVRGDHRGGEHPVPVAQGRHPHPGQPRHAPRPATVAATQAGPRCDLQVIQRIVTFFFRVREFHAKQLNRVHCEYGPAHFVGL